ncbi:MAG: hypothetical protein GY778_19950 [bacterium]|nr:hypothetical protein [bacterium]
MSSECPVCRRSIPWARMAFTTAWGRWRCVGCESLLGVDATRRFVLVGVWLALYFAGTRFGGIPGRWEWVFLLAAAVIMLAVFLLLFDRARVIERQGFRCRDCGYDLQGQTVPRCPECGRVFDADERARMRRVGGAEPPPKPVSRWRWAGLVGLVLLFLTTVSAVLGLLTYRAQTKPAGAGPAVGTPASTQPAGTANGGGQGSRQPN